MFGNKQPNVGPSFSLAPAAGRASHDIFRVGHDSRRSAVDGDGGNDEDDGVWAALWHGSPLEINLPRAQSRRDSLSSHLGADDMDSALMRHELTRQLVAQLGLVADPAGVDSAFGSTLGLLLADAETPWHTADAIEAWSAEQAACVFIPLAASVALQADAFAEAYSPTEPYSPTEQQAPFGLVFVERVEQMLATPDAETFGPMAVLLHAAAPRKTFASAVRLAALVGARNAETALALAGALPFRAHDQQQPHHHHHQRQQYSHAGSSDREAPHETVVRLAWGYAPAQGRLVTALNMLLLDDGETVQRHEVATSTADRVAMPIDDDHILLAAVAVRRWYAVIPASALQPADGPAAFWAYKVGLGLGGSFLNWHALQPTASPAAVLAALLVDQHVQLIGLVAISGTSDPREVPITADHYSFAKRRRPLYERLLAHMASVAGDPTSSDQALVVTANVAVRVAQAYAFDAISALSATQALVGQTPDVPWHDRTMAMLRNVLARLAFRGRRDVAFALDTLGVLATLARGAYSIGSEFDIIVPPSVCPWPVTPSQGRAAYQAIIWAAHAARQGNRSMFDPVHGGGSDQNGNATGGGMAIFS